MNDTKAGFGARVRDVPARMVAGVILPIAVVWAAVAARVPLDHGMAVPGLAIVVVPVAAVGWWSTPAVTERWARERGARVSGAGTDQLRRHLFRTRLARTLGVVAPFAVGTMLTARYNADPDTFRWYVEVWSPATDGFWPSGLGYVAASVWAELTKPHGAMSDRPGAAVLAPRRLSDYLDRTVRRFLVAYVALALAVTAVLVVSALDGEISDAAGRDHTTVVTSATAGVTVAALVSAWAICRRRLSAPDDAGLVYEELTRTGSVNALAGAAVAMAGSYAATLAGYIWGVSGSGSWVTNALFLVAMLGVGVWLAAGTNLVFRTQRIEALRSGA